MLERSRDTSAVAPPRRLVNSEETMPKRMRIGGCLALVAAAVAVAAGSSGCSSEPKDPFKYWDAGMK